MEMLRRDLLSDESELDEINLLETDIPPKIGVILVVGDLTHTNVVTIDEEATTTQGCSLMKLHSLTKLPVANRGSARGWKTEPTMP
jgi:hypothetical protein